MPDGGDIKCKCAKLERTSTGSLVTITNSITRSGKVVHLVGGLTFCQWEIVADKFFPGWELVACSNLPDDFDNGCTL